MNENATPDLRAALFGGLPEGGRPLPATLAAATGLYRGEPLRRRTGFVFQQFAVPEYVGLWNHRWARAFGFPIRAPLWDRQVMALADRRRELTGDKPLLRRFAATLLPHERAYAPKIYQELPLGHWFRGPLRPLVEDGLSPAVLAGPGLFDAVAVRRVVDDHLAGRADHTWPIWTMLTANEWARQLPHRPPPLLP
jgi:asparagine synthase (glutamine-hydrolysing)